MMVSLKIMLTVPFGVIKIPYEVIVYALIPSIVKFSSDKISNCPLSITSCKFSFISFTLSSKDWPSKCVTETEIVGLRFQILGPTAATSGAVGFVFLGS